MAISSDPSEVLGSLLPSYSPSRQKLTNSGETFRGRAVLFMIDGVPQSNPLRSGARDGYTIDMTQVERIEIIHGASAEHGLGATGGIVNFVTRRPESGRVNQKAGISATMPLGYESDGLSYKLNYEVSGSEGKWDYLGGASYQSHGLFYDSEDRPVGIDMTQGDTMNSTAYDILVKLGYWFDDEQTIEFKVNRFELAGKHDYIAVEGDRSRNLPATTIKGSPQGEAPENDVVTTSLSYEHENLASSELGVQVFHQRFRALYGGSSFNTFQDPRIAPEGSLFDQSQNESDKLGAKVTLSRNGFFDDRLGITGGVDSLYDETRQVLAQTGREWCHRPAFTIMRLSYRLK